MARGAVVGWFTAAAGVRHAAVLSPLFVDLGIVPGDAESVATGINDNNSVVGYSWDPSNYKRHAFIWTRSGGMHVLPSFETFMFRPIPCRGIPLSCALSMKSAGGSHNSK